MVRRKLEKVIVEEVQMGDIYRFQAEELSAKVEELLEKDMDDIAEKHKDELMELNKKIKESDSMKAKLEEMIDRAKLSPLERLLFDLRVMKRMDWDDIVAKIEESPHLQIYVKSKKTYKTLLAKTKAKIMEAGE